MVEKKSVDVQETQKMYVLSIPEGILNVILKLVNETPMARMVSDEVLKCLAPQINEQNKVIEEKPKPKKKRR